MRMYREGIMQVFTGSNYLVQQEARARWMARFFQPVGMVAVAVGVVGWLFFLVQAFLGSAEWPPLAITALTLFTLTGLILPNFADNQALEADNYLAGRAGEERLATFLQTHLSDEWTLFRNVVLPAGRGDLDAILAGPTGVYVLEVKTYVGQHRNVGDLWYQRNARGEWEGMRANPTRQARRNEERLRAFLSQADLSVGVTSRVVWASDGLLLQGGPLVSIWELRRRDEVLDDLEQGEPIDPALLTRVNRTLQARLYAGQGEANPS